MEKVSWPGSLSVVFPAYDEVENIGFSIIIAEAVLSELVCEFEIIVVSDGSTDGTDREVERLRGRYANLRLIHKERNEGYGYALRDGFRAARFPHVFFTDADRQFDMVSLKNLLAHVEGNDIVVGYRRQRQDTWVRKTLSFAYNAAVRILFDLAVRDVDCAFKVFDRRIFDEIEIESPRFFVNTEILAKARRLGFRVHQVGVPHLRRVQGLSKVRWTDVPDTIRDLLRIRRSIRRIPRRKLRKSSLSPVVVPVRNGVTE